MMLNKIRGCLNPLIRNPLSDRSHHPAERIRRLRTAASRFAGFGVSTVLFAMASIAVTPAMVAADGAPAWGAIALGQTVGAIASLVVSYGWAASGPSVIAQGDGGTRRREYVDSVRVKLTLLLPGAACAAFAAASLAPGKGPFAAVGAISSTLVALSSNWYFAGLARPYMWLVLETVPRVLAIGLAILMMSLGYSAIIGLVCISSGVVVAFIFVTVWILYTTARTDAPRLAGRGIVELLVTHRHGISALVGSQLFLSAPLVIVSIISPPVQPLFALADKVRQLFSAGMSPIVVVFQGWVPRGGRQRNYLALGATGAFAVIFSIAFLTVAHPLMHWLGNGQIDVPENVVALTSFVIAVGLFDSVLAYAVLASLGRLDLATRATGASIIAMIPLVAIGTVSYGAVGALAGMSLGIFGRVVIELLGVWRAANTCEIIDEPA